MGFSRKEAPNCDWCKFRKNCFYGLLEDAQSKKTWREMRVANRFRPGETIFYEGEKPSGAYVVCTGKVKIYKSNNAGQQLLTRIESPGDLVGHISMLAGWNYSGSAEAMEESVVSVINEAELRDFLLKHPKASLALLSEVSRDVRRGEAKARDIAFKPARSRLAGTLTRTMNPATKPYPIVASLKRKEIAEMAGLTIETTVRLLKDFEERGLTRRKGKDIVVTDPERLKTLAGHFS
ncbi:MAG TPA: Crp/Fnr family transcriptional regulator [Elusimicrobiota bacterium]|jgi:CRP/FNR family transcriptional regulator|nr:Crp/Fnr family transcriptional regulator [Elusimicrobiota bacterium]